MKRIIKIEVWRLFGAILLFILMGIVIGQTIPFKISEKIGQVIPTNIAYASGSSTANFTANYTTGRWDCTIDDVWTMVAHSDTATVYTNNTLKTGWNALPTENHFAIQNAVLNFDISGYDSDWEVSGVSIWLYNNGKANDIGWTVHFALYEGTVGEDKSIDSHDYDNALDAGSNRISWFIDYDNIPTTGWVEFPILEADWEDLLTADGNGLTECYLATGSHMYVNAPSWEANKNLYIAPKGTEGGADQPYLQVSYVQDTPARQIQYDTNAATDNTTDGTETADNITWESPRASYADEGMYFKCNGESGAEIELELQDANGNSLESVSDSIRVDGNYDWVVDVPDNWAGWIRVIEENNNLVSDWGYVMPKPDADQLSNTVFAVNTEYPQYDYAFSRYLTYENDVFVLHWKTNVQAGEEADHDLRLISNGENSTVIWNNSLDWLNENYYYSSAANEYLAGWRYAIFTPNIEGSGFDDYTGMIMNLDENWDLDIAGFIQALMIDTTDNSTLADSHSCYWYLDKEADGIIMQIATPTVNKGGDIDIKVQVSEVCQADYYLPDLVIGVVDSDGSIVYSEDESYLANTINEYTIEAPTSSGDYEIRFTFSGSGSWSYIHDKPFTVRTVGGLVGADSLIDVIKNWITGLGMDNPAGYWLITLVVMVALFLVAYKSPIMRVALPLVFLGFMMIMEFLDQWLVILLALGAGLTIWGIFRRKTQGGSEE